MNQTLRFARFISILFHPLITPAIAFSIILFFDDHLRQLEQIIYFLIAVLFSIVLIPLYIVWLKWRGVVESLDIVVREQRTNPLLVGALSYFLGFVVLWRFGAPVIAQGLMFCYATNTIAIAVITQWWKVSVHTTAVSGPLVALLFQFGKLVLPFLLIIPLVGWSRLALQRHTLAQVVAGATIGLGLTALQLAVLFLR